MIYGLKPYTFIYPTFQIVFAQTMSGNEYT